jgi:hypothetical protein
MSAMVLDVMKTRFEMFFRNAKHTRELILQIADTRGVAESILDLTPGKTRDTRGRKQDLLVQMRRRVSRDSDVVQIFKSNTSSFQTISNRLGRKPCRVLEPIEALFLSRGNQPPILDDRRRGIAVISIDTKDKHPFFYPFNLWLNITSAIAR